MSEKRYCKISVLLVTALIILGVFLPVNSFAATELSLNVSYDAKCGEPTTFKVQADGGLGNYMYYLGNITREGEDGQYFVMDPSRLPGYKTDNTFQFTFYASGVYYLHFYVMDKGASPIVTKRKIIKITLNDPKFPTIESIADKLAAECRAKCQTEYERALWLHDWLVDNCTYDYSLQYCGAEGALVRGKGTCESYHRAYTMLLNRVGIANGRIEGNGHVWTAVRIDGKWYQVDVTWDDNGYSHNTYENYLYFGLSDELMKKVHSDHTPNSGYVSNSLENNYLIKSGAIDRWSSPLSPSVTQNIQAGKTSFEIPVTESLPGSNQDVVYGIAAYRLSTQKWSTATHTVILKASYSDGKMRFNAEYTPISAEEKPSESQPEKPPSDTNSAQQGGNTPEKPQTGTTPSNKPSDTPNTNSGSKPSVIPNADSGNTATPQQPPSDTVIGNGSSSDKNEPTATPPEGTDFPQGNEPSNVPTDETVSSDSLENTPTEKPSEENSPKNPDEKPDEDFYEKETISDGIPPENDNNFIIPICIGVGAVLLIAAVIIIFPLRKKLFKSR